MCGPSSVLEHRPRLGVELLVVHQALLAFEGAGPAVAEGPFAAVAVRGGDVAVDVEAAVDRRFVRTGAVQGVNVPERNVAGLQLPRHDGLGVDAKARAVGKVESPLTGRAPGAQAPPPQAGAARAH